MNALQKRKVSSAAYWYLDRDDGFVSVPIVSIQEAQEKVLNVARKVKEAREKNEFICPRGSEGCFTCAPYEKIVRGEAEYLGVGGYNQDLYLL